MNRKLIIALHSVFWITYTGFLASYFILETSGNLNYNYFPAVVFFRRIYDVMIFYYFYLTVSPKLLDIKKIIPYIIASIAYIGLIAVPFTFITVYNSNLFVSEIKDYSLYYRAYYSALLYHAFLIVPFGIGFKLAKLWYENFITQKILKAQNDANELALLRAQINPHFLFNTLNNINSFIRHDPEKASSGIIKLSDIMRYMLYKSDSDEVLLEDEIINLRNYIELQKFRTDEAEYVKFEVTGDVKGVKVPPMIFMPFVENAFKHGRKKTEGTGIEIFLSLLNNQIDFSVINYIKDEKRIDETKGGFGMKNIKRRLELLFGNNYKLEFKNDGIMFSVKLKITLNENKLHCN